MEAVNIYKKNFSIYGSNLYNSSTTKWAILFKLLYDYRKFRFEPCSRQTVKPNRNLLELQSQNKLKHTTSKSLVSARPFTARVSLFDLGADYRKVFKILGMLKEMIKQPLHSLLFILLLLYIQVDTRQI